MVEDKAITIPMISPDFFEVSEDSTFELFNIGETSIHHDDTGFLTSNSTGAKHDDWRVLHGFGERLYGFWESSKRFKIQIQGVVKSTQPDFIIVPCIDDGNFSTFIHPLFEFCWRNLFSGALRRLHMVKTQGNYFLLETDIHSVKWLIFGKGVFETHLGKT